MAKKIINSIDRTALTPNYAPAWFTPVRGKKSILWDVDGLRRRDCCDLPWSFSS